MKRASEITDRWYARLLIFILIPVIAAAVLILALLALGIALIVIPIAIVLFMIVVWIETFIGIFYPRAVY